MNLRAWTTLVVLLALPPLAAGVEIEEWDVPWPDTRPRDPSVAPDGRVWFVGQKGNYLGVFDPKRERFEHYDLPEGTRPHTVVVDREGQPWVAGNGNGTLLTYGADGKLRKTYTVPERGRDARDPHTLAFDGKGGLWFTMQGGNAVGHLALASGNIEVARIPTENARPYGVVASPEGDAWVVLFGASKLAKVERGTLKVTEVALPRANARPRRLGLDAKGVLWYVDYPGSHLGAHDIGTGKTREWPTPSQPGRPYAMALDADGTPWFFETAPDPNVLQAFDPRHERFIASTPVQKAGVGEIRHMEYQRACNCVWFGSDRNTLGRAILSTGAAK